MNESNEKKEIDPWTTVRQRYTVGQVVTRIVPFGVFARIEDGIEGLIHPSELPSWMNPIQNLHEGQRLPLRILFIDAERHRLALSLRQADNVN